MEANGDATNEDSLRMYCAMAEIHANHIQCKAGHTNFEMCFGKEPLTVFDLVTQGNEPITFTAPKLDKTAEHVTVVYNIARGFEEPKQDAKARGMGKKIIEGKPTYMDAYMRLCQMDDDESWL